MHQVLYNDPEVLKAFPNQIEFRKGHDEHLHVLLKGIHPFSAEEVESRLQIDWYYPE